MIYKYIILTVSGYFLSWFLSYSLFMSFRYEYFFEYFIFGWIGGGEIPSSIQIVSFLGVGCLLFLVFVLDVIKMLNNYYNRKK
ncbi:MAG: hypothetical protein ACI9D5_000465 [Candidatus Endobugula sp.]|jgi:hypothetical protein